MLALALAMLLFAQQDDVVHITSDRQEGERGDKVIRYVGNVVATYQDVRVEAPWIEINDDEKRLTAGERVRFIRGRENLEGSSLTINLATKTGAIKDAKGMLDPSHFVTAGEIRRLEDGSYELSNATITECENEQPDWIWHAARTRYYPGKGFNAHHALFRFEGVPVFYMPYFAAPTDERERSSGFLIPSTSTSTTKGRSISIPFYYAINRSADATFVGEYFSKRGPAGAVEFRAIPNPATSIYVKSFFAIDRLDQGGHNTNILATTGFGRGYRGVADMNLVSDLEFRQVYEEGFNLITSPIEHSTAFLTNNQPRSSTNILYERSAVFLSDATVVLRKFPTLEWSMPTSRVAPKIPVYFTLNSSFTGLSRRDDRIQAANAPLFMQRVDVYPSLEVPVLRMDAFEWSHRFGVRETFYTHSLRPNVEQNSLNRFAADYETVFTGPRIERSFGTWLHVVEPSVEYRYVAGAQRFDETIVVDDVDLISNTNELEYSITNRFMSTQSGRELLTWRVAQKVFFDPTLGGVVMEDRRNVLAPLLDFTGFHFSDGPRRFSPIVSTLRISAPSRAAADVQVDYDTERDEFRSAGVIGEWSRGEFRSAASYFFTKASATRAPGHQLRQTLIYGSQTKRGISAAFSYAYDIRAPRFQSSTVQVGYNTDCYGLSVDFTQFDVGGRKESRIRFGLSLKNIGSFGTIRPQERLF